MLRWHKEPIPLRKGNIHHRGNQLIRHKDMHNHNISKRLRNISKPHHNTNKRPLSIRHKPLNRLLVHQTLHRELLPLLRKTICHSKE